MRIDSLRLIAFGPFAGTTLDLSAGQQGLHVVYGPNEAGKSTCRRALLGLLFGIPERSTDNFVHEHKQMRVGARLRTAAGETLDVVRRKARKSSLRDGADEAALADDTVARLLGGVDQPLYESLFCLDHDELVRGGAEVLQGRGQIGELLFAAGAGVAELRRLQGRLKDEADALYKPSGRNPTINQELTEWKAARQRLRDAQLSVETWQQHDERRRQAEAQREAVEAEMRKAQTELARLRRLQDALPLVGRWKDAHAAWEASAGVVLLADDFAERRERAEQDLRTSTQLRHEAASAVERLQAELDTIEVPEALLAEAEAIDELKERLGSHRKAMRDRPKLAAVIELAESEIAEKHAELGHRGGGEGDEWRLPERARAAIQELARRASELNHRLETHHREQARLAREIAADERELEHEQPARLLSSYQARLRRLQTRVEVPGKLAEAQRRCGELERDAAARLRLLQPWQGTLAELARAVVPSEEAIDRFEARREELEADCRTLRGEDAVLRKESADVAARLHVLEAVVAVPTLDDLRAARELRERGWRAVQAAWLGTAGEPGDDEAIRAAFPQARDLAGAYRAAVAAADEAADRLRAEADRVIEKANLVVRRQQIEARLLEVRSGIDEVGEATSAWQAEWAAAWSEAGIEPATPAEMRSWRRRQQELAALAGTLANQRDLVEQLQTQVAAACKSALELAAEVGANGMASDAPFDAVVELCAEQLQKLAATQARLDERRRRLPGMRADLAAAIDALAEVEKQLAAWRGQWLERMNELRLPAETTVDEAGSVLDTLGTLDEKRRERRQLLVRVQGIDEDAARFAAEVRQRCERVAPDLVKMPLEAAVTELFNRLTAARGAATRRAEREGELAQQRTRLERAAAELADAQLRLAALCREAGCSAADELREAQRRSADRAAATRELTGLEAQLASLAAGRTRAELVAEVDEQQADALPGAIAELEAKIDSWQGQRDALLRTATEEASELARMSGQAEAIGRAEECESRLARLENDFGRLAVLRLAGAVLREAVERYRQRNEGAVLHHASEIFAVLTGGSFTALRADIEEEQHVLKGVRAGTEQGVDVAGMSEGTRDQLYLALRLASIRAWLADHEAVPVVVDDVLVNFDDQRAAAALAALAGLAEHAQVIFFTHHRHLMDIARTSLPAGQLFVHHLVGR